MAIRELDKTYQLDPDADIPRLKAKYLVSAGLYDQAIETLRHADLCAGFLLCGICWSTIGP